MFFSSIKNIDPANEDTYCNYEININNHLIYQFDSTNIQVGFDKVNTENSVF